MAHGVWVPSSARAVGTRALASIAAACVLGALARADGSGQLGPTLHFRAPGAGFLIASDPSSDAGTLVVAGLPPGVAITKAYFYCDVIAAAPSITGATLNGQPLALTWIGTMEASVPSARFHAWRADVTSLFVGAGAYAWTTASGGTNRGACLALFGTNPGDTEMWEVQMRDGAHGGVTADGVEANWPNPVVFDNFLAGVGWPPDAEMTWVVAGGDPGLQERYLFESTSIAGDDPATQGMGSSTYEVTDFVTTATTSVTASCSELGDAIVWMLGIFRVKVCDPCVRPFCQADGTGPVPCPCGNAGGPGNGCASSQSSGAHLRPVGTSRPDTLVIEAYGVVPSVLTVLFQGDAAIAPVVFGDGLRCVGGHARRVYARLADGGGLVAVPQAGDLSLSARSAALGDPLVPGMTRWYQLYFRDPLQGFCNPTRFNASSGLMVPW